MQLVDDLLLAVLAHGELDGWLGRLHPEFLGARHGPVDGGRLEELLGGDTAPMETGAADLLLLDDRDRQAGCACVQRRRIASRPTADHYDVELAAFPAAPAPDDSAPGSRTTSCVVP